MTAIGKVESVADLGALIRQARQAAGMTQEELADQMGTTRNWMIRMEQGRCTVSMKMALIALSELGLEMTAGINLHSKNKLSESSRRIGTVLRPRAQAVSQQDLMRHSTGSLAPPIHTKK